MTSSAMTTTDAGTPAVGQPAPDFTLRDHRGQDVTLSDFRGEQAVLLVFYPFAFSGICTGELAELRDALPELSTSAQVLAISCDPVHALRAWAAAEDLALPLLSDFWPHGEVAGRYGVLNEATGSPVRGSFLVDRDGVLRWSVVNGMGQARDLQDYRRALAAL